LLSKLAYVTGLKPAYAEQLLLSSNNNYNDALQAFYAAKKAKTLPADAIAH
jgi:hypothetical protein